MMPSDIPKNYVFIELTGKLRETRYRLNAKVGGDSCRIGAYGPLTRNGTVDKRLLNSAESRSFLQKMIGEISDRNSVKPVDKNPIMLRELKDGNITVFHLILPPEHMTSEKVEIIVRSLEPHEEYPIPASITHTVLDQVAKACSSPGSYKKPYGYSHYTMKKSLLKIWDMIHKRKGEELLDKPEKRARTNLEPQLAEMHAPPPVGMYDAPIYSSLHKGIETAPPMNTIEMDKDISPCYRIVPPIIPESREIPVGIKEDGWEVYNPDNWEPLPSAPLAPKVDEDGWEVYNPDNFK